MEYRKRHPQIKSDSASIRRDDARVTAQPQRLRYTITLVGVHRLVGMTIPQVFRTWRLWRIGRIEFVRGEYGIKLES